MIFKTLYGSLGKVKKASKYRIKWGEPSRSKFQTRIKELIFPYWQGHIVFEEFPIAGSRLSLDFYNATNRMAIEVQGKQHTKYVEFFHGKSKINYLKQLKRDQDKLNFCGINDIFLLEIHDDDDIDYLKEGLIKGFDKV